MYEVHLTISKFNKVSSELLENTGCQADSVSFELLGAAALSPWVQGYCKFQKVNCECLLRVCNP